MYLYELNVCPLGCLSQVQCSLPNKASFLSKKKERKKGRRKGEREKGREGGRKEEEKKKRKEI